MMKAPTLFFCVLATLSSVVYAVPAQRRQVNELQDCQAKLDKDITTFNNIASTITSPILEIDLEVQFGPILNKLSGDYQECASDVQKHGKLSDSQAHDVLSRYRSSSNKFENGLNSVNAARKRSPFASVSASVNALGASVNANMGAFGQQVANNSPNDNNGANQKEANDITSGLQNAVQKAFN